MQKCLGVGAFMATKAWPVSVRTQWKATDRFIHHLRSLVTLFCLPSPTSQHQSVCLLLRQGFCWQAGTCPTQISSFSFVFGDLHQSGKQSQCTEVRSVLTPGQSLLHGCHHSFYVWRNDCSLLSCGCQIHTLSRNVEDWNLSENSLSTFGKVLCDRRPSGRRGWGAGVRAALRPTSGGTAEGTQAARQHGGAQVLSQQGRSWLVPLFIFSDVMAVWWLPPCPCLGWGFFAKMDKAPLMLVWRWHLFPTRHSR